MNELEIENKQLTFELENLKRDYEILKLEKDRMEKERDEYGAWLVRFHIDLLDYVEEVELLINSKKREDYARKKARVNKIYNKNDN